MLPDVLKVLKVRVKDKHAPLLPRMAIEVNQVWNFSNELSARMASERGHWMSGFDLQQYTNGASKEFELIGSATVQQVCEEFATRRRQVGKLRLRWRKSFGERRSLGWVPFKSRAAKWKCGQVFFAGHPFSVWDSYGLAGYDFRSGSFVEDSRGRWYFCLCVLVKPAPSLGQGGVGIDLGMKTSATCSDGQTLEGRTYRRHEAALGAAQRAGKTARARAINAKIRNRRQDALHKFSTKLVRQYGEIYVGSVSSRKLVKTRLAKSVLDAGWSRLKTMLEYKSRQAGVVYREIDEAWTTQTCSECGALGGPKGLQGLGMREWECGHCGGVHDRDVNAARNILALGRGHAPPAEGIPCL